MNSSESISTLAASLAKAQGAMTGAKKDAKNPHFRSDYATLASVIEAAREAMTANGLAVVQGLSSSEGALVVTTRIVHSSGEWIESSLAIPLSKMDAQGVGSAATYGRRYTLAAMVGLAQVDDDGNDAADRAPNGRPKVLPRAIPANVEGQDAFAAMPEDAKAIIREWAMEAIAFCDAGKADEAADFLHSKCETDEDKLAIWTQLPSNARAAIKKAQTNKRLAEQA